MRPLASRAVRLPHRGADRYGVAPVSSAASPSSRGPGHRPFTAATRVRIPVGTPLFLPASAAGGPEQRLLGPRVFNPVDVGAVEGGAAKPPVGGGDGSDGSGSIVAVGYFEGR